MLICFVGHKNSGAPPYKGSRKPFAVLDDRFDRLPWMELVRGCEGQCFKEVTFANGVKFQDGSL